MENEVQSESSTLGGQRQRQIHLSDKTQVEVEPHTHKELPSNQRHTEMKNCFNCRLELNNHGLALTD